MKLDRQACDLAFDVAVGIAPQYPQGLQVVTGVEQVLPVEHVVAGLVLGIDRRRIERVEEIDRVIDQPVAPGDRLAAELEHGFHVAVAEVKPVESVRDDAVVAAADAVGQVEQPRVVVDQGRGAEIESGKLLAQLEQIAFAGQQLVIRLPLPVAAALAEIDAQLEAEVVGGIGAGLLQQAVGWNVDRGPLQLDVAASFDGHRLTAKQQTANAKQQNRNDRPIASRASSLHR